MNIHSGVGGLQTMHGILDFNDSISKVSVRAEQRFKDVITSAIIKCWHLHAPHPHLNDLPAPTHCSC